MLSILHRRCGGFQSPLVAFFALLFLSSCCRTVTASGTEVAAPDAKLPHPQSQSRLPPHPRSQRPIRSVGDVAVEPLGPDAAYSQYSWNPILDVMMAISISNMLVTLPQSSSFAPQSICNLTTIPALAPLLNPQAGFTSLAINSTGHVFVGYSSFPSPGATVILSPSSIAGRKCDEATTAPGFLATSAPSLQFDSTDHMYVVASNQFQMYSDATTQQLVWSTPVPLGTGGWLELADWTVDSSSQTIAFLLHNTYYGGNYGQWVRIGESNATLHYLYFSGTRIAADASGNLYCFEDSLGAMQWNGSDYTPKALGVDTLVVEYSSTLDVSPDGKWVYASSRSSRSAVFSTSNPKQRFDFGYSSIRGMAVASGSRSLFALDTFTHNVIRQQFELTSTLEWNVDSLSDSHLAARSRIYTDPVDDHQTEADTGTGVAVNEDGSIVYMTRVTYAAAPSESEGTVNYSLDAIRVADQVVLATFPIPLNHHVDHMTLGPDGFLYAVSSPHHLLKFTPQLHLLLNVTAGAMTLDVKYRRSTSTLLVVTYGPVMEFSTELKWIRNLTVPVSLPWCVVVDDGTDHLYVGGFDGSLAAYSMEDGQLLQQYLPPAGDPNTPVNDLAIVDGDLIIANGNYRGLMRAKTIAAMPMQGLTYSSTYRHSRSQSDHQAYASSGSGIRSVGSDTSSAPISMQVLPSIVVSNFH